MAFRKLLRKKLRARKIAVRNRKGKLVSFNKLARNIRKKRRR